MVPTKLQSRVLAELHCCHPGVAQMKAVARSHVQWPKALKTGLRAIQPARPTSICHQKLRFTAGHGCPHRGNASMWTMLVL